MRSTHTSVDDWRMVAELLGEVACAASFDELREGAVAPLRRLLRADFVTFDRWSNAGQLVSYRADPDPGGGLAKLVEPFRACSQEHPVFQHWPDFVGGRLVMHLSELMPVRRFLRSMLWNEVYLHQGAKYQISIGGTIDEQTTWAVLAGRLTGDFGSRDRELCRAVRPSLQRAIARLSRHDRGAELAKTLQAYFARSDAAFLVATNNARILEISPSAQRALGAAVPGGMISPGELPAACGELRSALGAPAHTGGEAARRRFAVVRAGQLQALVLHLGAHGPSLVVLQESASTCSVGKGLRLTSRESEILGWIAEGKSNREIAALLGISPRTVEKHSESLFAKLGVESRLGAALLARQGST